MNREISWGRYIGLVLFAVFLGYHEASVAFYLRSALNIGADAFPLQNHPAGVLGVFTRTEYLREALSILVIGIASCLFSHRMFYRLLGFILVFGLWDLSYYAFLRLHLGWPDSVFSYDLLFLIPTVWVAPVFAPLLIAFTMTTTSSTLLFYARNRSLRAPQALDWLLAVVGALVVFYSFVGSSGYFLAGGKPPMFSWGAFWTGYGFLMAAVASYLLQVWRHSRMRFF